MLTAPPRGKRDSPSEQKQVDWVSHPPDSHWNQLPVPSLSADPSEIGCWLHRERERDRQKNEREYHILDMQHNTDSNQ